MTWSQPAIWSMFATSLAVIGERDLSLRSWFPHSVQPASSRSCSKEATHHASIREAGNDRSDPLRAGRLARRDENQELHKEVVRVIERRRLGLRRFLRRRTRASRRQRARRARLDLSAGRAVLLPERVGRGVETGLEDEDVLFAHGFTDRYRGFVVAELFDGAAGERDTEPAERRGARSLAGVLA